MLLNCQLLPWPAAGPDFERRIVANEATNQKFNFLRDGDPYNAYYRRKVGSCWC
jgi:hypothetical protein